MSRRNRPGRRQAAANPVGSRTGGPGGVGPGPQGQQRAPGCGAGDDRCRGRRAVVGKCDRRTRTAPGELLGLAQPDQPSQAQRLRHRDRARQGHPGPGRQVLRPQPRGHLRPQRPPVGRRQEDCTRGHPRVVHGELQQPVQLRPASRAGGERYPRRLPAWRTYQHRTSVPAGPARESRPAPPSRQWPVSQSNASSGQWPEKGQAGAQSRSCPRPESRTAPQHGVPQVPASPPPIRGRRFDDQHRQSGTP